MITWTASDALAITVDEARPTPVFAPGEPTLASSQDMITPRDLTCDEYDCRSHQEGSLTTDELDSELLSMLSLCKGCWADPISYRLVCTACSDSYSSDLSSASCVRAYKAAAAYNLALISCAWGHSHVGCPQIVKTH